METDDKRGQRMKEDYEPYRAPTISDSSVRFPGGFLHVLVALNTWVSGVVLIACVCVAGLAWTAPSTPFVLALGIFSAIYFALSLAASQFASRFARQLLVVVNFGGGVLTMFAFTSQMIEGNPFGESTAFGIFCCIGVVVGVYLIMSSLAVYMASDDFTPIRKSDV